MKLDRLTSGRTFAASLAAMSFAAAFACGCSTTTSSHGAQSATLSNGANGTNGANVAGTTNLMSAELAGPAPKVGKAHSTLQRFDEADSDLDTASLAGGSEDESAPKEARRSDGSHRGGGFGTSSK